MQRMRLSALIESSGILCALILAAGLAHAAPVVSNVTAAEKDAPPGGAYTVSNVRVNTNAGAAVIRYDLAIDGAATAHITPVFSKDGGETFSYPVAAAEGDFGPGITPGTDKTIRWRVYDDYPEELLCAAAVRVIANPDLPAGTEATIADMDFVWCPPGTFLMGSPPSEPGRNSNETQHPVTLTRGFWIGKYEVTQAQWLAVMGSWPGTAPSSTFGVGDTYPAYYVSWDDFQNLLAALEGAHPGYDFELPTEAQWEYACRAGTQGMFCYGDDPDYSELGLYAWYSGNNDPYGTKPVGGKLANDWGIHDMHGNVWEWCRDRYGNGYYASSPPLDPYNASTGVARVLRGGCWSGVGCRAAYRYLGDPDYWYDVVGARLVVFPSLVLKGP